MVVQAYNPNTQEAENHRFEASLGYTLRDEVSKKNLEKPKTSHDVSSISNCSTDYSFILLSLQLNLDGGIYLVTRIRSSLRFLSPLITLYL
jgi:hypothetical protein